MDRDRMAAGSGRAGLARLAALALAALALLPLVGKSGIWDPYELDRADLARRIAIHVFGARGLDLADASGQLPTLTDLGMGELGFTSMALGFRVFGLHDWAGRLPLALWGLAGALVLYEFLARLVDRRAGLYGVAVLVTMPLYVMQARTLLGDIVTMAALTMAFCGLIGALLEGGRGAQRGARLASAAWFAVGILGVVAGYLSRGLLIGVAVPALGAGLTWVLLRTSGAWPEPEGRGPTLGDLVGAAALVLGVAATAQGALVLASSSAGEPLPRALGVALLKKPPVESTFDLTLRQLGHALFPWSAFLPFAVGRLFRAPAADRAGEGVAPRLDREAGVRIALIVTSALAYGAFALLAPHAGALPFSGPALLAAIAALAIRDLERGAPSSRALAVGCAVLAFVLYRDLVTSPDRALSVFSVDKPVFPKSFEGEAASAMRFVLLAFAGLVSLTWFEEQPRDLDRSFGAWARRLLDEVHAGAAELARIWNGNLLFLLIVIEAALVGVGAMLFVGKRIGWGTVARMPNHLAAYGMNAWWALPLLLAASPVLLLVARDAFRHAVARASVPRAIGTPLAGLVAGFALSFWYYPALAAQLSPKEVFASYESLRKPGEPLATLGVRSRTAAYYQGGEVTSFTDVLQAFDWLTAAGSSVDGTAVPDAPAARRWLVVKSDDLPRLNSLFRKRYQRNLPVLDGRSSQILLASNELGGRPNESWLGRVVLDEPAAPENPLDAMFEDQLEVLGWELTDDDGQKVSSVVPQKSYHLRTYFRVHRPVTGNWKMFVHIDGFQRRYNGDHPVIEGRYPLSLWQPGDVVVDDHELQLEPNFTPGDYTLYFGLFAGETRFQVTRGPEHEDRVRGGVIRVR
ncbi:glycosyltransferase family 39 protein [Sorangium atrum]|uniref:Glycosyltransferase family 39 protein n=1 Tax=Sorangium atrum TaxID=2995308 RepID=A0ABT5BX05_9BACT|nr:glycosyltransferase family 39 protein [Sorangium aterium]MDC0678115.1 glycosyltransferase family 39 protein [Sorangium aterium]